MAQSDRRGTPVQVDKTKGYRERKVADQDELERFLIVCEGEKTEPNYFKSFRVNTEVEVSILGLGDNTLTLVKQAIEFRDKAKIAFDQVWCVFDRDSFPAAHFNAALELAKNENVKVAYSNEAFELWYLLHFHYYDAAISRQAYKDMLTKLLQHVYQKNSQMIYDELYLRQKDAIRNAKNLHEQYNPHNPEQDNPCTTVYLLVEQLNLFLL